MDTDIAQSGRKTTFLDLYLQHKFDIPTLAQEIQETQGTLRNMLSYQPVARHVAQKVLTQLSTLLQKTLTLEITDIPLIPTFTQVFNRHNVDLPVLAKKAEVTNDIVGLMIQGRAVLQVLAERVLRALSAMTEQSYTLENVDVNLLMIMANQSAVANIMQRIEQEYASSKQALQGPTLGTAQHKFMTKRLENIATHTDELHTLVGTETANQLMQQFGD